MTDNLDSDSDEFDARDEAMDEYMSLYFSNDQFHAREVARLDLRGEESTERHLMMRPNHPALVDWCATDFAKDRPKLADAIRLATEAHKGQKRKNKSQTPYIFHPLRVMERVRTFAREVVYDENLDAMLIASVLHDTLEDTSVSSEDLEKEFGVKVANLVRELTSNPIDIKNTPVPECFCNCSTANKVIYLIDKIKKMSPEARLIKLCDRLDNVCDLETATDEKFIKNYRIETRHILYGVQPTNKDEKEIMDSIINHIMYLS